MRKLTFLLFLFPLISFAQTTQKRFELSPYESKLIWKGSNFGGAGGHDGTLQVTSGFLLIVNNQITKGDFVIDMNSIRNTDQKDEQSRRDLEEHLRSDDFFSVALYPKAFFNITKIVPAISARPDLYNITGFLGIKGVTNLITFPATVVINKQTARAQADIVIDRTKWNITFQSKTIFATLKDGILADEVKISIDLLFKTNDHE
jgi:polyisoprenoid-binding protein YceI